MEYEERRLSSATVVKTGPCLEASYLPDVTHLLDDLQLDCQLSPTMPEICRTLVTEQVVDDLKCWPTAAE